MMIAKKAIDWCASRGLTFNLGAKTCQGLITDATAIAVDSTTTQFTGAFTALARFVLGDLLSFSPLSAPLFQAAASSATDHRAADASTTSSEASETSASTGGLSGAKVGIGVGVGCGVLLLCILTGIITIYRRRLRRLREVTNANPPATDPSTTGVDAKAEMGGDSHVVEIDGRNLLAEADGDVTRHELEGEWHGYEARGA